MDISFDEHTALLVIDVQEAFNHPSWGTRNNPDAEANISRLLKAWRETGRPVVHVHHDSVLEGGLFRPGQPGNAPKAEAIPTTEEQVYHKTVNSAFIGTTLENDLRADRVSRLVIVGLTTQHCVSTTARMAGNLRFDTYVVSDATAAFDQVGLGGRGRTASEVHFAALSDVQGEFATILETQTVIDSLTLFEQKPAT